MTKIPITDTGLMSSICVDYTMWFISMHCSQWLSVRRRRRSHRTSDKELRASVNGDADGLVIIIYLRCFSEGKRTGEASSSCLSVSNLGARWVADAIWDLLTLLLSREQETPLRNTGLPMNEWVNEISAVWRFVCFGWLNEWSGAFVTMLL